MVLNPLFALGRGLAQQYLKVYSRRSSLLLLGLDRHRAARSRLQPKAHHRFVNRANLFHIQRPVRDALAVEDKEFFERTVDRAVGHKRRLNALVYLARVAGGAAFKERK